MGSIYLDHNATTPIDPIVLNAMEPYFREIFGNPSSVEHEHGHQAATAVNRAREQVASVIGAKPNEVVFTASCTEANNMAILGVARAHPTKKHIVTSSIEHPSIMEPARALEKEGWRVTYLPVDSMGLVSLIDLENSLTDETSLVSIMAANNEVGTVQPIKEIGEICSGRNVLFHTDLAQIIAYSDIDVQRDHIHLASMSAHKAYGPKGVGALYVRSRRPKAMLEPIMFGGGQERGFRPGTLNTPYIVGMGEAFAIAKRTGASEGKRLRELCSRFRELLSLEISGVLLNGHPTMRLPNNLSFSIAGVEPFALMRALREAVSFSASSACSTDKIQTSPILQAMFGNTERSRAAFRIAPGRFTTESDMDYVVRLMIEQVSFLRGATL